MKGKSEIGREGDIMGYSVVWSRLDGFIAACMKRNANMNTVGVREGASWTLVGEVGPR